jgi:hypothetical protein
MWFFSYNMNHIKNEVEWNGMEFVSIYGSCPVRNTTCNSNCCVITYICISITLSPAANASYEVISESSSTGLVIYPQCTCLSH